MVTFGGLDVTFNVASRGNHVADQSYDVDGKYLLDQTQRDQAARQLQCLRQIGGSMDSSGRNA